MPKKPRALIYCRVSSDPKNRGRSVSEQETECRATCEREGWQVLDVIVDNDRSASRHAKRKREGWTVARSRIEAGDADVLVTWEASRAQRDLTAYTELRDLCASTGTLWSYSGTTYDLEDRSGRFRTGLDALLAEDEAERTRERVTRAMRANAQAGRPHGKVPFGYRRIYDDQTRELIRQEPHPKQGPLVQEAARRTLAGESARSIALDFNKRGIPSPRNGGQGWQLGQITRMLRNPLYAAKRVHKGEVVGDGDWPALIEPAEFERLQAILTDPARRTSRASTTVRLLSGVARCGKCGGPMSYAKQGGFTDGQGVKRPVRLNYTCRYNQCVARDLPMLEEYVERVVLDRLSQDDAREALTNEPSDEQDQATSEADQLQQRLDDAVEQFTAGKLSAAILGRIEADLKPQIDAARRTARVRGLPTAAHDLAASDDPAAAWSTLGRDQQREVVRALMEVVVEPVKKRGQRGFDPTSVRIEWKRD